MEKTKKQIEFESRMAKREERERGARTELRAWADEQEGWDEQRKVKYVDAVLSARRLLNSLVD